MTVNGKPEIKKKKLKESSTCITFYPDLPIFKMSEMSDDLVCLLKKRVYDIAGIFSKKLKVFLNE